MSWSDYAVIGLLTWITVAQISQIGKPREPFTVRDAAIATVINIGLIVWVVLA